jgi:DNA-directed RNA polymerase specialized sigma24 family protein
MNPFHDPAELVGRVASARRPVLLRTHSRRLRREDLEDCFSQAVLEMVLRARAGTPFESSRHVANALEQRFLSRIHDRRRALSGRSPMQAALEAAVRFGHSAEEIEVRDRRHEPERLALARVELRELTAAIGELSADQRRVLAAQLAGLEPAQFQHSSGWTAEKYRKTALRARVRLRALLAEREAVPAGGGASDVGSGARS